ncbi:MAG: FmdB family zinc ribbon protein [Nitrospirota bacterium]
MPIYEYECAECGKHFDEIQKFSDDALTQCKFCGGPVRKLLGAPALQFKGTGWYITDYAGKSPRPESGSKGADKGEAKGDKQEEKKDTHAKTEPTASTSCPSGTCAAAKADK